MQDRSEHLRVLIANERQDRLKLVARVIKGLGHEVVASETSVDDVGAATARERPDVAIVGLGESAEHALELVAAIVRESFCPVIAVTHTHDPEWVNAIAATGVYAYILEGHADEIQSAIEITLRRYADYQMVQGAFRRRDAELVREQESSSLRQRDALQLHERVVQGLSVALLALELGHHEESKDVLTTTLSEAKALVARTVAELQANGVLTEQLIRDSAGR